MYNNVSMYVHVCSDTSSTCLSRMRKRGCKDRHYADARTCNYSTAVSVEYQYTYVWLDGAVSLGWNLLSIDARIEEKVRSNLVFSNMELATVKTAL